MKNSPGRAANCRASICPIDKSLKLQATSSKLQAPSNKRATICRIDTRCRGATICHIDTRCRGATLCLMDQGPRIWYYDDYNKTKRAHMRSSMRAVSQPRDISGHKPPIKGRQSSQKQSWRSAPARGRVIPSPATICHIDKSFKQQAPSPKLQASSSKPSLTSSLIREPRYMDTEKVLKALGPRASAMINVLCGCFTWKAI